MKYRIDIDGLRAISVLSVVFFHAGFERLSGGFVGVDVFFVISGFLIGGIVIGELERGAFTFGGFYERRVRRIVPAYVAVLAATGVAALVFYLPFALDQFGKHLTAAALFLSNFSFYQSLGDYWAPRSETNALLHTWSLAVEEQFYLVFPLVLILAHRLRRIGPVLAAVFVLSLAACLVLTARDPKFAFYMLPTRAWEFAAGTFVFLAARRWPDEPGPMLRSGMGLAGLALIAGAALLIDGERSFPGYLAIAPVLGAALVLFAGHDGRGWAARVLALQPLPFIGRISYSLYLWHWPVGVFYKAQFGIERLSTADGLAVVGLSCALAVLSWRLVETPFRHGRRRAWLTVGIGAVPMVALFAGALAIRATDGLPQRYVLLRDETARHIALSDMPDPEGSPRFQTRARYASGGLQFHTGPDRPPRVVVIGVSHGAMMAPAFHVLASESQVPIAFFTHDGLNPFTRPDPRFFELALGHVERWRPEAVFVVLRWENNVDADGQALKPDVAARLRDLAARTPRVIVVDQVPRIAPENTRAAEYVQRLRAAGARPMPVLHDHVAPQDRQALRAGLDALGLANVELFDPVPWFGAADALRYHDDGWLYWRDDDHLNLRGARMLAPVFAPVFTAAP